MSSDLQTRCADAILAAHHLGPDWQAGYDPQDVHLMREDASRGLAAALRLIAQTCGPTTSRQLTAIATEIDPEPGTPMPVARHHRRRTAQLKGDPTESARLRRLFMASLGKTDTVASICAKHNLPVNRISRWTGNDDAVLAADLQQTLRTKLGLGAP